MSEFSSFFLVCLAFSAALFGMEKTKEEPISWSYPSILIQFQQLGHLADDTGRNDLVSIVETLDLEHIRELVIELHTAQRFSDYIYKGLEATYTVIWHITSITWQLISLGSRTTQILGEAREVSPDEICAILHAISKLPKARLDAMIDQAAQSSYSDFSELLTRFKKIHDGLDKTLIVIEYIKKSREQELPQPKDKNHFLKHISGSSKEE